MNPQDIVPIVAFFLVYLVVDRVTGTLSEIAEVDLARWSLTMAAIQRRVVWWAVVVVAVAVVLGARPDSRRRLLGRWAELDHGAVLRLLAAPLIVFLAWKGALYPYNVHAGQLHLLDRFLLLALAAAALWRPALLIPFALQFRVISAQTVFPFHTTAARNIDDLPVVVLLLIGVGHLLFVLTGRRSTSLIVLAIGAALASHFWIPGKGKLLMGWLSADDPANLPLAAYTAGWLGHTDGAVAAAVASVFDRFGPIIKVATIILELGSLVAVAHRRLLRPWLIGWIGFHVVTFITTGFFFFGWILAEVGLLVVLTRRDLRPWVDENATWLRAAAAVVAVAGAPVLFHPPGLAWIDAPVSYGYRMEAVGESGTTYALPPSTMAPLEHEVMFKRLQFEGPGHLSGAYGALESPEPLDELDAVENLSDLLALEAEQPEPDAAGRAASIDLITDFMSATAEDEVRSTTKWLHRLDAPTLFWSSWSDDDYHFDERLDRIEVTLLTRVHGPGRRDVGTVLTRTDPVLTLTRLPDGSIEAVTVRR
ncbi:MAG: hypothetical protein OEW83_04820 [Acidimicrobiia bacterium]|nr:hypothetical protein [Acidimicrobiia bacterium]